MKNLCEWKECGEGYGNLGCCEKSSGVIRVAFGGKWVEQYEKMNELLTSKWVLKTGKVSRILDSRVLTFLCEHKAWT